MESDNWGLIKSFMLGSHNESPYACLYNLHAICSHWYEPFYHAVCCRQTHWVCGIIKMVLTPYCSSQGQCIMNVVWATCMDCVFPAQHSSSKPRLYIGHACVTESLKPVSWYKRCFEDSPEDVDGVPLCQYGQGKRFWQKAMNIPGGWSCPIPVLNATPGYRLTEPPP